MYSYGGRPGKSSWGRNRILLVIFHVLFGNASKRHFPKCTPEMHNFHLFRFIHAHHVQVYGGRRDKTPAEIISALLRMQPRQLPTRQGQRSANAGLKPQQWLQEIFPLSLRRRAFIILQKEVRTSSTASQFTLGPLSQA